MGSQGENQKRKTLVVIPTTSTPVFVLNIMNLPASIARSTMCVNRTTTQTGVAAAYNDFVRFPTGVVHRFFDAEPYLSYRVDVSGQIEAGSSWQLAMFIAHAMHHAGDRLAFDMNTTAELVWATGELDAVACTVLPVDHVSEKILLSRALFEDARRRGLKLRVMLPTANFESLDRDARATLEAFDAETIPVHMINDAFHRLGLPMLAMASTAAPAFDPKAAGWRSDHKIAVGVAAACALLILAGTVGVLASRSPPPPPPSNPPARSAPERVTPWSCGQEAALRSQGTTAPTGMIFVNDSDEIRRVYWLNFDGRRVLYGAPRRGAPLSLQTYVAHPWVVTDGGDACLGIYMPAASQQTIDVR
jgi:hypothetical protein